MSRARVELVVQAGAELRGVIALGKRFAPEPERLVVHVLPSARPLDWLSSLRHVFGLGLETEQSEAQTHTADTPTEHTNIESSLDDNGSAAPLSEHDLHALARWAKTLEPELTESSFAGALVEYARQVETDLLVLGPLPNVPARTLAATIVAASASGKWSLFVPPHAARQNEALAHVLCPVAGDLQGLRGGLALLREPLDGIERLTLLALSGHLLPGADFAHELEELLGFEAQIEVVEASFGVFDVPHGLQRAIEDHAVDLLVVVPEAFTTPAALVARLFGAAVLEQLPVPALMLPARPSPLEHLRLDVADLIATPKPLHEHVLRVESLGLLEHPQPVPDARFGLLRHGRPIAMVRVERGDARLDPKLTRRALEGGDEVAVALGPVQTESERPSALAKANLLNARSERPLLFFDAGLEPPALAQIATLVRAEPLASLGPAVGVRTRREQSFSELRTRLREAGFDPVRVACAGAMLDDGQPDDLVPGLEALRLVRAAARLRTEGTGVGLVVHGSRRTYAAPDMLVLGAEEMDEWTPSRLREAIERHSAAPEVPEEPGRRFHFTLDALTASRCVNGNEVRWQLDNGKARLELLEWIRNAKRRVHLQTYIVEDDTCTREIAAALAEAGARGVEVRFLVDSLYGRYGSLAQRNPVLAELAERPGVEVRALRPIEGVPDIKALKRRDHRKLLIVDGERASVSGRNLGAQYLTGFDELAIKPQTHARRIPWLDAGVSVRGPLVTLCDQAFREAWVQTGGKPFELVENRPREGGVPARLVLHEGLADAHTLDVYVAMIRAARSEVTIINTFPPQREIVHAIRRAVNRGVRVRVLFGNVRPVFGPRRRPFPGQPLILDLGTAVVHARMDELVRAGAEAYEFMLPHRAPWHRRIETLFPHVHAKVMTIDGQVAAVGSANLHVTSGFWESEAQVVVHDAAETAKLERVVEGWLASSSRIDPDDPEWRRRAERRAWLDRWWPDLIG